MDENLMKILITKYDKDGDDKINYNEFVDFYSKMKAK